MLTGPFAYEESKNPGRGSGFYPILMAALRVADTENLERVRVMFPDVVAELGARYNAPGGELEAEVEARIEKMTRPPTVVVEEWWALSEWQDKLAHRVPESFEDETTPEAIISNWLDLVEKRLRLVDPAGHRWLFEGGNEPESGPGYVDDIDDEEM